ncbi:MAG: TraR/DksA family transcriptional regulator [Gemmataceae bacterium]
MARQDTLLRVHKTLLARRDEILKKLRSEMEALRNDKGDVTTGDSADAAFEAVGEEMASQLAELDARELAQIERALQKLKQGTYGTCEGCSQKIGLGRLNALPYSTLCINCQREMEEDPMGFDSRVADAGWERAYETARALEEPREVRLSDLELKYND